MKKRILLIIGILLVATAKATNTEISTNKTSVIYRYNDAVTFTERGIQFHVFLNGEFDFDTHYRNNRYYDYNGNRYTNGVRIDRDYRGRVRRVGNVFINYDIRGNVKRIGNVYMQYRFGQLSNVGNLRIIYDRWGYPHFRGFVKPTRYYDDSCGVDININIEAIFDYDDVFFYRRDFRDNYRQFREDANFFYYRANPNARIGKRSKILKRRKPISKRYKTHRNQNITPEQRGPSKRNNSRR